MSKYYCVSNCEWQVQKARINACLLLETTSPLPASQCILCRAFRLSQEVKSIISQTGISQGYLWTSQRSCLGLVRGSLRLLPVPQIVPILFAFCKHVIQSANQCTQSSCPGNLCKLIHVPTVCQICVAHSQMHTEHVTQNLQDMLRHLVKDAWVCFPPIAGKSACNQATGSTLLLLGFEQHSSPTHMVLSESCLLQTLCGADSRQCCQ